MSTFVLVHGAFRGGWAWQRVRRRLQARGHDVFTPTLTGMGDRAHAVPPDLSLTTWALDVARLIECEDLRDVVLAGHSMGGMVVLAAAQHRPDRLAHLVFIDAPVLRPGERAIPDGAAVPRRRAERLDPTPVSTADGYAPHDVAWVNARLGPTPVAPSLDPLVLDDPRALALPRTYAFCRDTPPSFPSVATRSRFDDEGVPYQLLPSAHDAPITNPDAVAELLGGVAR